MSTFRLAGLLRLRRSQEEVAAAELARANAEREAARQRRRGTEELLHGSALPDRSDVDGWRLAVAGRAALAALVAEHSLTLAAAAVRADAAGQAWTDARIRTTTLDKLADRHAAQVRAEEGRAEQVELDETATRRATTAPTAATAAPGPAPAGRTTTTTPEGER